MLHRLRPPPHLWGNPRQRPPPAWLLVLQRVAVAVALALPLVALRSLTRGFAALGEWLALVTVALGVVLVARVVTALQRWRLGNSDLLELRHAARSVVLVACSFLSPTEVSLERLAQFVADLKRLVLVYVALALQDCREVNGLPEVHLRALLRDDELQELNRSERNRPRAAVVELWIRTRVNQACFATSGSEPPLLPHAVQAMELHHNVSSLPLLYDNVSRAWSQPPTWGLLSTHTPSVVFGYLVFYTAVHASQAPFLVVLLWVFSWGLGLFGLDALALTIETRHVVSQENNGQDHECDLLELTLLELQDEIDAATHAFFRPNGGLSYWERWNRSVLMEPRRPRRSVTIPRSSSSIAPASPRRSPGASPGSDDGDGLGKPSLKHVLDMITTSPSTSTSRVEATVAERQPLLQSSTSPPARYDLFLRREDESSGAEGDSDATDVDEEEGEEYHLPV